jgi:hypothetical protein
MTTQTDDTVRRYPLQWPVGTRRTPPERRRYAQFKVAGRGLTITDGLRRLKAEARRMGLADYAVSSNVTVKLDGDLMGKAAEPADPGAAFYFRLRWGGQPKVFACDRFTRVGDNLAAIAAHMEAMRAVERYGVGQLDQMFEGYTALPPSANDWRSFFGFHPDEWPTSVELDRRYQAAIRAAHPDGARRTNAAHDLAVEALRKREEA